MAFAPLANSVPANPTYRYVQDDLCAKIVYDIYLVVQDFRKHSPPPPSSATSVRHEWGGGLLILTRCCCSEELYFRGSSELRRERPSSSLSLLHIYSIKTKCFWDQLCHFHTWNLNEELTQFWKKFKCPLFYKVFLSVHSKLDQCSADRMRRSFYWKHKCSLKKVILIFPLKAMVQEYDLDLADKKCRKSGRFISD